MRTIFIAVGVTLLSTPLYAQVFVTEGTNIAVDVAPDGRLATDLLGTLWVVPGDGGEATRIGGAQDASAPRWSPAGDAIAYTARQDGRSTIWLWDSDEDTHRLLSGDRWIDRHPDWHPDGDRIVFSSRRHDSGFDIWEMDVATGLTWRLTRTTGNESEPAWSGNGRDLAYVHELGGEWSIKIRHRDGLIETLVTSNEPVAAPSWRPDGSLITYLRRDGDEWSVAMTILSEPRLTRTLIEEDDLFLSPVSWVDRQRMRYSANGRIRKRRFNAWSSVNVPFRARVTPPPAAAARAPSFSGLDPIDRPAGTIVIRAARIFDGVGRDYRDGVDIVVEDGIISAIEPSQDRPGAIVIDVGPVAALPGFVDAFAELPADPEPADGPLLLALGVTTLVTDGLSDEDRERLNTLWAGKEIPGPRVLSGGWHAALRSGYAAVPGNHDVPTSPDGRHYEDVALSAGRLASVWLSGLADGSTPGLDALWRLRATERLSASRTLPMRFAEPPAIGPIADDIVVASQPSGLPTGIGLQAEFRALAAAGLSGAQILRAAGINAARAVGLEREVGRIAVGSVADLVLVDGDPVGNIADAANIIAVVRNGRFFSVSGLIDRSVGAQNVE